MMFVHLSVCLFETGVHCDHTVDFSADLSLVLCSGHPDSKPCPPTPNCLFQFHLEERCCVDYGRAN